VYSRSISFFSWCFTQREVGDSVQPVKVWCQDQHTEDSRVNARLSALLDLPITGEMSSSLSKSLAYSIKNALIRTASTISSGRSPRSCRRTLQHHYKIATGPQNNNSWKMHIGIWKCWTKSYSGAASDFYRGSSPGCISIFSVNLTFDKTLMMQFSYFFLQKSPCWGYKCVSIQNWTWILLRSAAAQLLHSSSAARWSTLSWQLLLSDKVFKLSFEYIHIYNPKSGDFAEKKTSKIASLMSCQRSDLRKHWNTARAEIWRAFNEYFEYVQTPPLIVCSWLF